MEEYKIFIDASKIALIIPIIYMMGFFLKGKNRNKVGFFSAIVSCLEMYITLLIPILLKLMINDKSAEIDPIMIIVFNVIIFIFFIPFLSSVAKNLEKDFYMPYGFKANVNGFLICLVLCIIIIGILVGGIWGFMAGGISLSTLVALMYMFLGCISLMSLIICKKFFRDEYNKLNKILTLMMFFATILMFILIIIFES